MAVTPDGKYAYVNNEFGSSLSVIDTATNEVTATITLGENPGTITVAPNGSYVYVTSGGNGGTVLVISTAAAPAANQLFSALGGVILIIVIIIVVFLIILVWYRRSKKKTQPTQATQAT